MTMVALEGGSFHMGSVDTRAYPADGEVVWRRTISSDPPATGPAPGWHVAVPVLRGHQQAATNP